MRIGVDATCWANPRGYGRFTRELLPEMVRLAPQDTFVCFLDEGAAAVFSLDLPNVEKRLVSLSASQTTAAAAEGFRSPVDMLRLSAATATAGLDVFFSPSVYTYYPLPPGLRAVITIHDAIADRYPELTLPSRRARVFWRIKVSMAIAQARLIMTVSDYAAREIADVLRVTPARIRVAVEAPAPAYAAAIERQTVDAALAKHQLAGSQRWFVYVGGFNPHKNVDLLVRAHAQLTRELGPDAPLLLLIGPRATDVFHSDEARIARVIEEEQMQERVRWLGFVSDDDLRAIHSAAVGLILPSTCEGFGLPAVEAAACGAPVIATTASPLPELLEGGGLFIPPGRVDVVLDALRTLATDEGARTRMGRTAQQRALSLSWTKAARCALDALYEAA